MGKTIDLSAIVTVHNEGLVAHRTMRSVFEALSKVKEAGYTYEIIVHIDNGDEVTVKYFERYKDNKEVKIFKNKFGDTGPSRNFAVQKAEGKYVAFLDGDDLISDNWYVDGIKMLNGAKDEIIVHPEAILTFGIEQANVLTLQKDSYGVEKDTTILLGENRWCSVLIAKRETLLKIPYMILGSGYGHEDYIFNIKTAEEGILHKVAKGTILFYRRSDGSRLSLGNQEHLTIPYMEAFDFDKIKKYNSDIEVRSKRLALKNSGYKAYKKMRDNEALNYVITPVAKMALKFLDRKNAVVPEWVVDEWKKMNHIDTQLYPYENVLKNVQYYDAEEYLEVGETCIKIARQITRLPNYVFIVPWIVRGGADKVLFNYINALKEIHPGWHFTVIATLPAKNTWAKNLPKGVDFVDFGNFTLGLNPEMQDEVMSRLITQLKCRNLHIINSEYGYNWVRKHKNLVGKNYDLNVSLFAYEYIKGSKNEAVYSYDNPCLFEIFDVVKSVFTDNATMVKYAVEQNGFSEGKFKVHYQPIKDLNLMPIKERLCEDGKMHILWAGRVVSLKLPELVAEIGRHLDARKFTIDVYGELSSEVRKDVFGNIPAIRYCGAYDGFNSLPVEKYDALLYTSLTDGMPNVILEATAAGLPIIASNDGGVGEFVENGKTGILIEGYLSYGPYVGALNNALKAPRVLFEYAKNAQKLLLERHSFEKFVQTVRRDIG